jgi:hypothetical protein
VLAQLAQVTCDLETISDPLHKAILSVKQELNKWSSEEQPVLERLIENFGAMLRHQLHEWDSQKIGSPSMDFFGILSTEE